MLRGLTKNDWQRTLGIPDERIPQALILRGTRNLRTQSDLYRQRLANVMEVGSPNGLIEDVLFSRSQAPAWERRPRGSASRHQVSNDAATSTRLVNAAKTTRSVERLRSQAEPGNEVERG